MKYPMRILDNAQSILEGVFLALEIAVFGVAVGLGWAALEIRQSWEK